MTFTLYEDCPDPASLTEQERNALVMTYTRGPDGIIHPLSRYGEDVWDYRPLFPHAARGDSDKRIEWTKAPAEWAPLLRETMGTFQRVQRPGGLRLDPATLPKRFVTLNAFAKWCSSNGITRYSAATPFDLVRYVQKIRAEGLHDRTLSHYVGLLRRVYDMREHLTDSFTVAVAREISSQKLGPLWEPDADEARRTELLPIREAAALFTAALDVLNDADRVLDIRDELENKWSAQRGRIGRPHWGETVKRPAVTAAGFKDVYAFESRLMDIRTAAYIVLAQSTGCRVHELGDAKVGCVFQEDVDGVSYYWFKASTRKIGDGPARWLAPEIARRAAAVLERHSAPLRDQLKARLIDREAEYTKHDAHDIRRAALAAGITEIKRNMDRLFLSAGADGRIASTDTKSHNKQLNAFARRMGIGLGSPLHTHRFRRTYAVIVVRLNKGVRVDLVTLREHFKHASVLMTEWYASLSDADRELLGIIDDEVDLFDGALVDHWLQPETPLAGGLGERIKAYAGRHHKPIIFKSRKAFLESIRDGLSIRATGHSWCLAEGGGCGGQGLFEATRCADCGHGVIDDSHVAIWQGIRAQQQELLTLDDIGPGGRQKAADALAKAEDILETLLGAHL